MGRKCKMCGIDAKFHDLWLWNAHINMWKAHVRAIKFAKRMK
jgi:hypothetical protein